MIKVIIVGANGRMGKKVFEICSQTENVTAVCGIDINENLSNHAFPVFNSFNKIPLKADVIIDFSSPSSLDAVLDYAVSSSTPAVLCSTGYTAEQVEKIKSVSNKVALFRSANMSLVVNAIINAVKEVAKKLYGFDVEVIEKHHHNKVDAPSGTALMLADAVKEVAPEKFYVYGREGLVGKRNPNEIGIHAVRGGSIVGEHDVIFAGDSETVTISHTATDRTVFAVGAVKAGIFMSKQTVGLFNMSDVLNSND